jgi:hypothetical protein
MIPTNPRTTEDRMTDEQYWIPPSWTEHEINDATRVFLTHGDFARGQRRLPVGVTWIGSFASGQSRKLHLA